MNSEIKYTREDYIDKKACSHREFYSQFVTEGVISLVKRTIGVKRIVNSVEGSFNDIPLRLWDSVGDWIVQNVSVRKLILQADNAVYTMYGVCIAKEAAAQIKERHSAS